MARRAFVFLHNGSSENGTYVGPRMLTPLPLLGAKVVYVEHGTRITGRVRSIQPADWNSHSELTPMVHILEDGPALPAKTAP
jgi:hypothetical protein